MSTPEQKLAATAASSGQLAELADLANQLYLADAKIMTAESELKTAKAARAVLAEKAIPELMANVGMAEFTTSSGLKLKIKPFMAVSIPEERRAEAYVWLEENGHGGLIKRTLSVAFGRDADEAVEKLKAELVSKQLVPKEDQKVEPQTLKKWAKDRLEAGNEVPDCITVFTRDEAEIVEKTDARGGFI